MDWIKNNWLLCLIGLVVLVAVFSALNGWYRPKFDSTPDKEFRILPGPEYTKYVTTRKVIVNTPITVLDKEELSKARHHGELSAEIRKDPDLQITATAEVEPYRGKTVVDCVLDSRTGETRMIAKKQPVPLFGFENEKAVGVAYGMGTKGEELDVYGRWNFARIGNLYTGAKVEINSYLEDSSIDAKAMLTMEYRF